MKTLIPFALCSLIAGSAFALQDGDATKQAEKPKVYKVGSTIDASMKLKDITGKEHSFKDFKDKVVVVHFSSITCPYMKPAEPKMIALQNEYAKKDVVVLAINANATEIGTEAPAPKEGEVPYADIAKHVKEKKVNFPVIVDHGNKVADLFQAQSTPHCFVIDQKGKLAYAGALDDDPKNEKGTDAKRYVNEAIDALIAGKEIATPTTKPYGCSIKRAKAPKRPE